MTQDKIIETLEKYFNKTIKSNRHFYIEYGTVTFSFIGEDY